MRKRKFRNLVAAATGATVIASSLVVNLQSSGAAAASNGHKTIGIVSLAASSAGSAREIAKAQKIGKKRGWSVHVVAATGSVTKVNAAIHTFVAEKVNGIVVDVVTPSVVGAAIATAKRHHIKVISTNSNEYDPKVTQQIVANPFVVGSLEATYVADRLNRKGNVAVLEYSTSTNISQRTAALLAELKTYPTIHVVATHDITAATAASDAQNTVQSWLTEYPKGKLTAIVGPWDTPAVGAAHAVDAAGRSKTVFVTSCDYDPATGQLLKQNKALQVVFYIDYTQVATIMMKSFSKMFSGKKISSRVYLNVGIVTPHTVPGKKYPKSPGTTVVWSGH